MKNVYKMIGLVTLMLFSFYYTEKIAILMQNKSPIMQNINEIEKEYYVEAVNANIDGDYITPGISGRMINKTKSYVNMKSFGTFNEYYLIFDDIKPDISLQDNKDKIIKNGNYNKKSIAFLLEENSSIENYFVQNKIAASVLVTQDSYNKNKNLEQINNDLENYNNVESLLNKNNQNTNICYINTLNREFCEKNKKYLVKETFYLDGQNIVEAKKNIQSGVIILVKKNANLDQLKLLIKEINFKGLNIVQLSELINEKNNE